MVVAVDSPPPSAGRSHPTYKEMVVQALSELRESGGSSRRAISKYISDHFSGLPACHDALLSVHLRRLKSQGLLLISGYSYLLPTATNPLRGRGRPRKTSLDAGSPPGQKRGPGRPRKKADLSTSALFQGVKRGPGRPPKNTTPVAASGVKRGPGRPRRNTIPLSVAMPAGKRGRGRPPKNAQILTAASCVKGMSQSVTLAAIATTPVLNRRLGQPSRAALNYSNVTSVRRGCGRPPKVLLPAVPLGSSIFFPPVPSLVAGMRKRGQPPKEKRPLPGSPRNEPEFVQSVALTTRGPGRPRKERSLGGGHLKAGVEVQPQASDQAGDIPNGGEVRHLASSSTSSTEKRGRGRPRRRTLEGGEVWHLPCSGPSLTEKQGRGRPRKRSLEGGEVRHSPSSGTPSTEKRGRGRPRKRPLEGGEVRHLLSSGAPSTEKRGRGRPRKWPLLGGEVRYLPSSGTSLTKKRGRGRPRKRPLETGTAETGVDALVEKRGPGRPRKKNPSAPLLGETEGVAMRGYKRGRGRPRKVNPSPGTSSETEVAASMDNKSGRGRPKKYVSFGTAEAAVEVSRDLAESDPKKEDTLVSGNKTETESILLGARMETRPTDAGGVLVSEGKVSTAHVEAEGALGVNPVISNLDIRSL